MNIICQVILNVYGKKIQRQILIVTELQQTKTVKEQKSYSCAILRAKMLYGTQQPKKPKFGEVGC